MESVADFAELDRGRIWSRLGQGWARRMVHDRLGGIEEGLLHLEEGQVVSTFGKPAADGLSAAVRIHHPRFYTRLAFGGSLGAGESYMAGEWDSEDPTSAVRLLARNRSALGEIDTSGGARLADPFLRLFHRRRANTRSGSRRNIEAHYDLGNEFFELFLDPSLLYSSAWFARPDMTLAEAQEAKMARLCDTLDLGSADRLLEIGTGWGAMAVHAAGRHGCQVDTTTISPSQHAFTRARVEQAGLGDRVNVLAQDYRDLEGTYDKLVSIEMIEAVGVRYLDQFFEVCAARLRAGGHMALQAITIAEPLYEVAARSVDFIQRYIFPGSFMPSVSLLTAAAARAGLVTVQVHDMGASYARTLELWRERFVEAREAVRGLGFSERFERMWIYYFCYCEGGFLERTVSDVQILFEKPRWSAARS